MLDSTLRAGESVGDQTACARADGPEVRAAEGRDDPDARLAAPERGGPRVDTCTASASRRRRRRATWSALMCRLKHGRDTLLQYRGPAMLPVRRRLELDLLVPPNVQLMCPSLCPAQPFFSSCEAEFCQYDEAEVPERFQSGAAFSEPPHMSAHEEESGQRRTPLFASESPVGHVVEDADRGRKHRGQQFISHGVGVAASTRQQRGGYQGFAARRQGGLEGFLEGSSWRAVRACSTAHQRLAERAWAPGEETFARACGDSPCDQGDVNSL